MIKSTSTKTASTGGTETRLAAGAAARSSFRKDGTGVDVPVGGAFSTAGASGTPKGNDADNEVDDDEDPPLDGATVTTALVGRVSDERGTLWTQ
jgi:hypothetical protein